MGKEQVALNALVEFGHLSHFGILIFDSNHKTVFANNIVQELLGLGTKIDDTVSHLIAHIVPEDKIYLEALMYRLQDCNAVGNVEVRLNGANGQQMFISCHAYVLAEGTLNMWLIDDLTESRRHERYLVEYGAKKNTLLDTLTHQLHGALQLTQHLTLAAKRVASDDEVRNYLDALQRNSGHCIAIINDLLNEEHTRSPDISVKHTRVNVLELVFFIYHELKKSFPSRRFDFIAPLGPLYVETDEVKLLQVVNNLLSNAVKFTPPDKLISIIIEERDGAVVIEIRDQGIGIPDTLRPYIFDRFSRAGRQGLNGERSFGLGLSICKRLVTLMDGMLWADSEEGKGSTFYILIPLCISTKTA